MKLHTDRSAAGGHRITAYGAGFVTVNESVLSGTVLLGAGEPRTDFTERRADDLSVSTITRVKEQNPELVLIGTGRRHVFPSVDLFAPLIREGIGVECMSTPAACRTFNILSAEGRRVVALLLPIERQTR